MQGGYPVYGIFFNVLLLLSLTVGMGCGGGRDPSGSRAIPVVSHVFVLVEENHSYDSVIGNPLMPYTNQLAHSNSLATQYYANTHNSLPNYFMLTTGNLIANNDLFSGTVTSDNVARALTKVGKSWKIYAESMPNIAYKGPTVGAYARDHNPFSYFSDVLNSSAQAANMVPFAQLSTDLQNGTLPDYAMIIPNLANNGHDCPPQGNCDDPTKLANIDLWISTNISPLINSSSFQNSVLIYTWDESVITDVTNGGGHVATILVGPRVRAGYQSTTLYQHQSTLKLTMQLLGVTDFPGGAASAPDMSEFFSRQSMLLTAKRLNQLVAHKMA